jgi:hypothetical protein
VCAGSRQRPQRGNAESSQADDQYSFCCHFVVLLPPVESRNAISACGKLVKNPVTTVRLQSLTVG